MSATAIPSKGTPEFNEFVRKVAEARYPKIFAGSPPENEVNSMLVLAEKWVKAVAAATQS